MDKIVLFVLPLAIIIAGGVWWAGQGTKEQQFAADNYVAYDASQGAQGTDSVSPGTSSQAPVPTTNTNNQVMSAILHTTKGDITIEFLAADAPNTVANFTKLAKDGFYNGTKFHRVIAGFMIQGGDPLSKDDSQMARWGTGGPGYQFADEIHANNRNVIGTISMANSGPNTNGSQFFINTTNNNFLDPKHTVFGKVTAGMEVVKAIEATATGQNDRPLEAMVINSITLK